MENNFLDELLLEVEAKEQQMELSHVDLVLKEISSLNSDISKILSQLEEERQIISDWALKRSSKLNERAEWLTKKLEAFMNEQEPGVRTIDLAHGQLLRRKQVEKIVVEDLEQFLQNNNLSDLTTTSPEVVKPDLTKIKQYYKMTKKIPLGTSLVESTDKFSIKLKGGVNGTSKNGTGSEQADED
ncbi:MAG: host-nuclease inhibitor Gam family protein [Ignavibacteriales bacterium]|nr:host-nuclease inhibitor Gam family protein [Ignavibacteriales bacterium]